MGSPIRLGRFFGIPVALDWSLLVIAALLTWSLAAVSFPAAFPGIAPAAAWSAAGMAALLFFGSILAHELGHSIVARRHGVAVESITLWLLGGVARLRGEAPRAGAEAQIALAGPAVSVLAALVFFGVALSLDVLGAPVLAAAFGWLALINGVLAVFNLIPAAPLDGGRVLAAAVWAVRHDREVGHMVAASAGFVVGAVMIAGGLYGFLAGVWVGGLWMALLGWFVLGTARTERSYYALRRELRGRTVREVTIFAPVVPGWIHLDHFLAEYGGPWQPAAYPVARWEGGLAGVVTPELVQAVPVPARQSTRVVDVCAPLEELARIGVDDALADRLAELLGAPAAVVFDGEHAVGVLLPSTLARSARARTG